MNPNRFLPTAPRAPRRFRRAALALLTATLAGAGLAFWAPSRDLAWAQPGPDTDAPVIRLLEGGAELTEGRKLNRPALPVIEVTDASPVTVESTIDGVPFVAGSTVSGEGTHQLAVTATDAANNTASVQVGFEVDTVAPAFGSVEPADGSFTASSSVALSGQVTGAVAVTVDGQAATLAGATFSAGPFTLAPGTKSFALAATDAAGNRTERTVRVTRDSVAPTLSIGQPASGALFKESTADVSGTVVEPNLAGVTVNGIAATVTGQTFVARGVPLAEGVNALVVRAVDRAGTASEATRSVTRDSEPPAVTVTDPAPGTVVPGAAITLRGTALDSNLDRVDVNGARAQISGGAWSYTATLAAGTNTFLVRAYDRAGNGSQTSLSVFRDGTAPAVRIEQPAQGTRLAAATATVSGTVDTEEGLTLKVNGQVAAIDSGAFSVSGVPLVEGENTLTARARDAQGNEGVHTRRVIRDSVAPRLLASDPGAGALAVPTAALFRLTFSEAIAPGSVPSNGGAALQLQTGTGQGLAATVTVAGEEITISPAAPLPSSTQIRLVLATSLLDLAGNGLAAASTLTFFTADTSAPPAPVLAAPPPPALCAPALSIAGSAEPGAVVRAEGGAASAEARADENGAFSLSVSLLPETGNRLRLVALDAGGNASPAYAFEVVHDCLAPRVLGAERQGSVFRVAFSEKVAATGLAGAIGLAAAQGALAGSVALASDGRAATFTPTAPLPAGALRLEVATGARDLAGNALAYPWSQVFGAEGGDGFLAGTVIDDATGRPLAGARVLVYASQGAPLPDPRPEQVTGADGRFRLPVAAGTHDLTLAREGYTPAFRVVTVAAGRGTDVFDPRLTPEGATATVGVAGGELARSATGASLELPAGALGAQARVALTDLSEQGLPTPLPYGWSPRGAVWLSLSGQPLLEPAVLSLPVEAASGVELSLIHLDLATLQWRVLGTGLAITGRLEVTLPAAGAGLSEGAWAAVEADQGPLAPPAPTAGAVLPGAPHPRGDEPTAATLTFNPQVVLPAQTSLATAVYTLSEPAASGVPLTLSIVEELTLADGPIRRQAPYEADLILYQAPNGTARSRFSLRPSAEAQSMPLRLGAENVTLRTYGGDEVAGNVVGADGGTVTSAEGDRIDVPAGAVFGPTAIGLTRLAPSQLGVPLPAGTELAGIVGLDLGGARLLVPASLSLALDPAPAAVDQGLLLQVIDLEGVAALRPVAALLATATGWTTAPIAPVDLPWPGVAESGTYAFVRLTIPTGLVGGQVFDLGGAPLAGALVRSEAVDWVQLSSEAAGAVPSGSYVLPLPVGTAAVTAENRTTGNRGSGSAAIVAPDARIDLDLTLAAVGPRVVATTPAEGAADVPQGIEPTVRFSEAVDPSTVAAGIEIWRDGQPIAVSVSVQGVLARIEPRSTLEAGALYELRIGGEIRDLQGNPLTDPVTVHFTTRRLLLPDDLDLSKVFLIEPDATGEARVLGRPGAVPAETTVFVENVSSVATTTTVTAGQDGGFELPVAATLAHRLVLHVLLPGANEVVTELTPFRTADLKGAYVGSKGTTFTTGDGIEVQVDADTFSGPTRLRVEPTVPSPSPLLARDAFAKVAAFRLDFGGAEARKALGLRLPLPAGAPEPLAGFYLLNRQVEALGEDAWMMHDLMRKDGPGHLTTAPDPAASAAGAAMPGALTAPGSDPLQAAQEPGPSRIVASDVFIPRHKLYVPGAAFPGQYQVEAPLIPLGFTAFPSFAMDFAVGIWNLGLEGIFTRMNAGIERLLEGDAVWIPTRLNKPVEIVVRDLATGYKLFEGTFDPPTALEPLTLPRDVLGDREPPFPAGGNPLRFLVFDADTADQELELAPGIVATRQPTSEDGYLLRIEGQAGSTAAEAAVRLLGLDNSELEQSQSDPQGAFVLSASVQEGHRFLLAVAGVVEPGQPLTIAFNEALGRSIVAIEVYDANGRALRPRVEPLGSRETFTVRPEPGWRAGETYKLTLGPSLSDDAGNEWRKTLSLPFKVAMSRELDTFELAAARDVARLGSLLFVAADDKGLYVLDATDPADLKNVLDGDRAFVFPLGDAVRGVTVDPHGRVLMVGGGVTGFGQLKILDPLALTPAAIAAINAAGPNDAEARNAVLAGSTIVSDKFGGPGTQLPSGTPRRVAALSSDDTDEWREGETPPTGLVVQVVPGSTTAAGLRTVTVTGPATKKHPVSLFDVTLGRWHRVDASEQGTFQIALEVGKGSLLRLLRNRQTVAYVATQGVGVEVVDIDKIYRNPPPASPIAPAPQADVRGIYSGYQDPELILCGQHESDLGSVLIDLDTLFDKTNPHPLTVVGLAGSRGLVLVESNQAEIGVVSFVNEMCTQAEGSTSASGLDVLQGYRFDLDGDGKLEKTEARDYAVVAHRLGGLLVYDLTDRENIRWVGQVKVPGNAAQVSVDVDHRVAYVAAGAAGLIVVDFDRLPSLTFLDQNRDGIDDRVIETIALRENTNAPAWIIPELGIALAGGLRRGLTSLSVNEPLLRAVARNADGSVRAVDRLAPFGVPTAKESSDPQSPDLAGAFLVEAHLPGSLGQEIKMDLLGVGPSGKEVVGLGEGAEIPPARRMGEQDGLVLRRLSDHFYDPGYSVYRSREIAALADPRAARQFERSEKEDEVCERCDLNEEKVAEDALELLSGEAIDVRYPAPLRTRLASSYTKERLDAAELALASVRWETAPAVRQEPAQSPSFGMGEVFPGTILSSGELSLAATDLYLKGRGLDFAFTRTYRSQTIGNGPMGPGWEIGYRQRLRELPNGDVEHYDGRGRRELWEKEGEKLKAPPGRFATLERTAAGWVLLDAGHYLYRFDRFGRWLSVADPVKESEETGNEILFGYDLSSRLVRVTDALDRTARLYYDSDGRLERVLDPTGREVEYAYDDEGRLEKATSPAITIGLGTFPEGLTTTYAYGPALGSLAARLAGRDNLQSVTDARDVKVLELSYEDFDGDGREDEVASEKWGEGTAHLVYEFEGKSATVTDRRGNSYSYQHDADGHPQQAQDPSGAVIAVEYNDDGLPTQRTEPLGRVTTYEYTVGDKPRSRGNLILSTVEADGRGPNGSSASRTTRIKYEERTNQPVNIVDGRDTLTTIEREESGLPQSVTVASGTDAAGTTQYSWNDYGQPVEVTNANGHTTKLRYATEGETEGYLESVADDPGGLDLETRYEVDERGNVLAEIDPKQVRHDRTYNEVDWLVEVTEPLGLSVETEFDAAGLPIEERMPVGDGGKVAVRRTFGDLGELLTVAREISPGGPTAIETYTYDENLNPLTHTGPEGQVTKLTYDTRNLATQVQGAFGTPAQVTETLAYDTEGGLTSRTDGRGGVWTTKYDGFGRVAETSDPLGNKSTTAYENGDLPTETKRLGSGDALLARGTATWDARGRAKTAGADLWSGASGGRSITNRTQYDPVGNVTGQVDSLGRSAQATYDGAERLASATDPAGNKSTAERDRQGNPTRVQRQERSDAGQPAQYDLTATYDDLGRPVSTTDPVGGVRRKSYDVQGNVRLATDPEQFSTEAQYDGLNRPTRTLEPEGIGLGYVYDKSGRLTSYTDALGNKTSWTYDALDRLTGVTYPDGTSETRVYDSQGNLTQMADARGTIQTMTYDLGGRMTARSVSLSSGVEGPTLQTFVYDGLNRLTRAQSGDQITTLEYDSLSRVVGETQNGKSVRRTLDDAGNVTSLLYPSGYGVASTYDALDLPVTIRSGSASLVTYGWRGEGLPVKKDLGNGLTGQATYDPAGRMLGQGFKTPEGLTAFGEDLSWNPRGLQVTSTRRDLNGASWSRAYDGAGRLVAAGRQSAKPAPNAPKDPVTLAGLPESYGYQYDTAQNLLAKTSKKEGAPEVAAAPLDGSGRNRPGSIKGIPLTWDANGNMTGKGSTRFFYDAWNRLVRIADASGTTTATYLYDAFNRRTVRILGSDTYTTVWDGWQPIEEYKNGELVARRTYGAGLDEMVSLETDPTESGSLSAPVVPLYDRSGHVTAVTGNNGKPIERYSYSPYGEVTVMVDSTPPAVQQLRVKGGALWLELSEEVSAEALEKAVADTALEVEDVTNETALEYTVSQPVQDGRFARRRVAITLAAPPVAETQVRLKIPAAALHDLFLNLPAQDFERTFAWPAQDAVLFDDTAPKLDQIVLKAGVPQVTFTEEPSTATLEALEIDGEPATWTLSEDRYTVIASAPLTAGGHSIAIGTGVADLDGQALATPWTSTFTAAPALAIQEVFRVADPRVVPGSTIWNPFAFQGLPKDPESGLVYVRNRFYDPETGRFVSVDPLGYVDGPNPYGFAKNDPVNGRDPLGLASDCSNLPPEAEKTCRAEQKRQFDARTDLFMPFADWWVGFRAEQAERPSVIERRRQRHQERKNLCPAGCIGPPPSQQEATFIRQEDEAINTQNRRSVAYTIPGATLNAVAVVGSAKAMRVGPGPQKQLVRGAPINDGAIELRTRYVENRADLSAGPILVQSDLVALARMSSMLRAASRGKGNFGVGEATAEEAQAMGEAWVGTGFISTYGGSMLISKDGTRQYRAPTFKPRLNKTQANFESRPPNLTKWQHNAHVDIVP